MNDTTKLVCPYCKAPAKWPPRIENYHGMIREYPTTYECGTVTSPNWSPPIRGKTCTDKERQP